MPGFSGTAFNRLLNISTRHTEALAMKKPKGRPDLRRVRGQRTYTTLEAANILGVAVGTVRTWLRADLPTLDESRPILILGSDLKKWLSKRSATRKRKCRPDEMFCMHCRFPRKPHPGTTHIVQSNQKTLRISGSCVDCGATMNRAGAVAKIQEIVEAFGIGTIPQEHIAGCENPLVKRNLEKELLE